MALNSLQNKPPLNPMEKSIKAIIDAACCVVAMIMIVISTVLVISIFWYLKHEPETTKVQYETTDRLEQEGSKSLP